MPVYHYAKKFLPFLHNDRQESQENGRKLILDSISTILALFYALTAKQTGLNNPLSLDRGGSKNSNFVHTNTAGISNIFNLRL